MEKQGAGAPEPLQGHSSKDPKSFNQAAHPKGPTSQVTGTNFQPTVLWENSQAFGFAKG